jgi:uncharacterized protein
MRADEDGQRGYALPPATTGPDPDRLRDLRRDRDAAGRPRNARPRDGLGRPLPREATTGVARVPDELAISLTDAIGLAQTYFDTDRPFHAHEVLEALWKSRPAAERDLWQGLAQIAVGVTHALRGNCAGAIALLERGRNRLRAYGSHRHGIAVDCVLAQTAALIDILRAETARASGHSWPEQFRIRLTGGVR